MTPLEAAARAIWAVTANAGDEFEGLEVDLATQEARAAISAYLKACAEDEAMRERTELRILEQFTGGMRYDRAVDHWLCPKSEQAARNLMSNARVAVLTALEPKE